MPVHRDLPSVGHARNVRIVPKNFDEAENIVPPPAIKPSRMLSQLV